jgi:transposase
MATAGDHRCPNCVLLEQRIVVLEGQVATLLALVAKLQAQLAASKKNSTNSSKPPSSDIVKPPRPGSPQDKALRKREKRLRGAQPGHPRHERPPFVPEEIDERTDYALSTCPDCGGPVTPLDDSPRILQQVEVVAKPITISEHRGHACYCSHCRKTHYAEIPPYVRRAGLVGPRLTSLVAFLKGGCHCSFTTIRKFLRDVIGVTISRGQLRKVCGKVSDSLDAAYDQLLAALPNQARLNVDETGHKEYTQRLWTWCFRAATFTLFKIDPSRSSQVLLDVLGREFQGVLGCDYFSAYRKYMADSNVLVQFCLAHLLRDVRFLVEHPNGRNRAYGQRLLAALRELFGVIHRRDELPAAQFAIDLQNAGDELLAQAVYCVPSAREAQNLAKRFRRHGASYVRFITIPGIEPTNNLAEQAIRFVVIDRLVTQGSRSESGRRWLERIWTTMASCAQQGRSTFEFLVDSVHAFLDDRPSPTLLHDTS